MHILRGLFIGVLALVMLPFALAQSEDAQRSYRAGGYQAALVSALEEGDAHSLAFAARAVLAEGIGANPIEMDPERLARALDLAEQALVLNPQHDEARLQKAITLSLRARSMSARLAYRARLGRRARALGEAVIADTPDNVYAHGFLAVWHVEVIRRGGRLGTLMLGASLDKARDHYERACELAPGDVGLHWQWARVLSATNPGKYAAEIDLALTRVEEAVPADHLSAVLRARALSFRVDRDGKSAAEIREMAAALL